MIVSNDVLGMCKKGLGGIWELPDYVTGLEFRIRARETENSVPVSVEPCCQLGGPHVRVSAATSYGGAVDNIVFQRLIPEKLWSLLQRHKVTGKPVHVEVLYEDQ